MATPINTPEVKEIPLPDIDPSLPKDNGLLIDKIGVKGLIHEGTDWENILKLGVWRVPNFGTPEDNSLPLLPPRLVISLISVRIIPRSAALHIS